MIDLGLTTGIKDLWQESLLRDYTLVVEGREFQVHKVVLAAVSQYFKAMLCEGYIESKRDEVEVKGFTAHIVGKLLDFIYAGDESIITDDTLEVLKCAMYLQMPLVSQFCVKKLVENISVKTCLEIVSALIEYSFKEELKKVLKFVWTNWEALLANCKPDDVSYDVVQFLIDRWEKSEWDMFMFLKNWIDSDYNNHIGHVDDLIAQVRFCLISPDQLQTVTQMDIFFNTEGQWRDLVVNAVKYHHLPIHNKVVDKSEQSRVRTQPLPAALVNNDCHNQFTCFGLDEQSRWRKHGVTEFDTSDHMSCSDTVCLEINNFLVVCATIDKSLSRLHQEWQIFDPRTLTWAKMPNMEKPKIGFVLVQHSDHLYVIGGQSVPKVPLFEMQEYSFLANQWTSVRKLPTSLCLPAACVLGDVIYVSGGYVHVEGAHMKDKSDGLYRLDLSSETQQWEKKAPCLSKCADHKMFVCKRLGEQALFIIDQDLNIQIYNPSGDQWSKFTNTRIPERFNTSWLEHGTVVAKGNSVFVLNVDMTIGSDDPTKEKNICWNWIIPEHGMDMTEVSVENFPASTRWVVANWPDFCGALLAISPQHSCGLDRREWFDMII